MARHLIPLALVFAMAVSCYHEQPETTFDMNKVLSAEKMTAILVDLHLADGVIALEQRKGKDVVPLAGPYLEFILQKHGISKDMLEESMRYYAYHVNEFEKIYENAVIELGKIQSKEAGQEDTGK
jgi:hypothetical protein